MSEGQLIAVVGVGSFVVGVLVGVVLDDARDQLRTVLNDRKTMHSSRFPNASAALLILTLALNVFVGGLLIKTRIDATEAAREQSAFVECVGRYNQQFQAAYRARLAASTSATDALDRVMNSVAARDRDEFRAALANYVSLRQKAKESQQANPYPPLPSESCGAAPVGKP